jgi:hypothetical protein
MPHPRHRLARVSQRSRAKSVNTVIESRVDVAADIAAINHGEATRRGNEFEVNGRTYAVEPNGTSYPVSGDGVYVLDRAAYRALGVYNQFGLTDRARAILDLMGCSPPARAAAREAYLAEWGR